jgi:hypothetical protein
MDVGVKMIKIMTRVHFSSVNMFREVRRTTNRVALQYYFLFTSPVSLDCTISRDLYA